MWPVCARMLPPARPLVRSLKAAIAQTSVANAAQSRPPNGRKNTCGPLSLLIRLLRPEGAKHKPLRRPFTDNFFQRTVDVLSQTRNLAGTLLRSHTWLRENRGKSANVKLMIQAIPDKARQNSRTSFERQRGRTTRHIGFMATKHHLHTLLLCRRSIDHNRHSSVLMQILQHAARSILHWNNPYLLVHALSLH